VYYYNNNYEYSEVMEGYGDKDEGGHYKGTSKRWYIIRVLLVNLAIFFLVFYFFTV